MWCKCLFYMIFKSPMKTGKLTSFPQVVCLQKCLPVNFVRGCKVKTILYSSLLILFNYCNI